MKLSLQPSLRRAQRGYSLVELSIALAILSVVIVGALLGVQRILANNNANQILRQVPLTNAAMISSTTSTGANFAGITNAVLANLGNFPAGSVAAGVASNPFGGNYFGVVQGAATVAPNALPANQGYFMVITGVPNSMCSTVASGVATLARAVYVINGNAAANIAQGAITTAAQTVKAGPGVAMNLANLSAACGGNATTKSIAVHLSSFDS